MTFNAHLLVFVRAWNMPWGKEDEPMEDSWMRVPCFRSPGPGGKNHYLCVNPHVEGASPIVMSEEDNTVIKAGGRKLHKVIPQGLIESVRGEAIDVPAWEYERQESWPYLRMFDPDEVRYRYGVINGQEAAENVNALPNNHNFAVIRKTVSPRPCRSCGRNRRVRMR